MYNALNFIKATLEKHFFGVCEWWGDMLDIRIFFIYTTFLSIGSPIIIYLTMAFWKKLRDMILEKKRGSVWDL